MVGKTNIFINLGPHCHVFRPKNHLRKKKKKKEKEFPFFFFFQILVRSHSQTTTNNNLKFQKIKHMIKPYKTKIEIQILMVVVACLLTLLTGVSKVCLRRSGHKCRPSLFIIKNYMYGCDIIIFVNMIVYNYV